MVSGTRNGIKSVASKARGIKANPHAVCLLERPSWAAPVTLPLGSVGSKTLRSPRRASSGFHSGFFSSGGNTLEQVMVKRLVGREDRCHLVVVGRMDVLINAVARELHLPQREGEGQKSSRGCPGRGVKEGQVYRRYALPGTGLRPQLAHTFSTCRDTCLLSSSALNRLPHGDWGPKPREA